MSTKEMDKRIIDFFENVRATKRINFGKNTSLSTFNQEIQAMLHSWDISDVDFIINLYCQDAYDITTSVSNNFKMTTEQMAETFLGIKAKKLDRRNYGYLRYLITERIDPYERLSKVIDIPKETLISYEKNINRSYKLYFIWKDEEKTKKRYIEAPDETLKLIQERILYRVIYPNFAPTKFAHGFCKNKSIVSMAKCHTGKKFVLKMDLKNFFPSIKQDMALAAMIPYLTPENGPYMKLVVKLCSFNGRLPQGAPTSPAISNIYCIPIDLILNKIAECNDCVYSRYADDMVFSSNDFNKLQIIKGLTKRIVEGFFGLRINNLKTKILKQHQRQTVTGLVVNKEGQVSVKKRKRLNLRAYIHHILTGKVRIENVNMAKLKGHINLINMANPNQGKYFLEKLRQIEQMSRNRQ